MYHNLVLLKLNMEKSMSMSKLINLNPRTYWEDIRYIKIKIYDSKHNTVDFVYACIINIAKQH